MDSLGYSAYKSITVRWKLNNSRDISTFLEIGLNVA